MKKYSLQKAGTHLESTTRLYGVCVDALANQTMDIVSILDRRDNKGRRRRQSDENSDVEDEGALDRHAILNARHRMQKTIGSVGQGIKCASWSKSIITN